MSFPNTGVTVNEFSNLFHISPYNFRDLMDALINSTDYSRKMVLRYPHDGFDPITGEAKPELAEPCSCAQPEFHSYGMEGLKKCKTCQGSGVRGGWKQEIIRGFFWNKLPPGLKNFSLILTTTLPSERIEAVIYVSAHEKNVKNGRFIITNYASEIEEEQLEEFQIMNARPIIIGEIIIYKWVALTRHPVKQSIEEAA